jgi:transposase
VGQFLSKARTAQALAELFATPVSEGTVATMSERAAEQLDGLLDTVCEAIADAEVAGFDESGLRVAVPCTGCVAVPCTGCIAPAPTATR